MALTASRVASGPVVTKGISTSRSHVLYSFSKSAVHCRLNPTSQGCEIWQVGNGQLLASRLSFSNDSFRSRYGIPVRLIFSRDFSVLCQSTGMRNTEAKECTRPCGDCSNVSR